MSRPTTGSLVGGVLLCHLIGLLALFLATQGWEVTGFDISDVGVQLAREAAQKRGLKLAALVDDVDHFDYGQQRWDLVVGMYMHAMITRSAAKIIDSLRPGGIIVVEGFHRDLNRHGLQGGYLGYRSNELLRAFDRLRVLYYEDTVGAADWDRSGQRRQSAVHGCTRTVCWRFAAVGGSFA
jgi:SAM-dependent methyltransferase